MGASADEVDCIAFKLVDQQEVAANVAFTVIGPIAAQRMIAIFGRQWLIRGQLG